MSFILQRRMAAAKKDSYIPLPKAFSVAKNKQVYFSPGNLQYQASTNTWRFAENQWDYVGDGIYGNVYENNVKCNNELIDENYSGWIDLFGWGTSGNQHRISSYQPWSSSTTISEYYAYDNSSYNLFDSSGDADWGHNIISNTTDTFRTLTIDEWRFLLYTRQTQSGIRYVHVTVHGVCGVILVPDDWDIEYYSFVRINSTNGYQNYSYNIISDDDWISLEQHGAVFLPAAGGRIGASMSNQYPNDHGAYWSSSNHSADNAEDIIMDSSQVNDTYDKKKRFGASVRLVKDVQQ